MQATFHHEDIPPQNWLDELQGFNIPLAWDIQIDNKQRSNIANRAQDQLSRWRTSLREQMKKTENRYNDSNRDAMKKTLAPYQMLDELGTDLHTQLRDLLERVDSGRAIPQQFEFGSRIFGDLATQRWNLGERPDEQRWRDFLTVERRYQTLTKEFKVQSRGYDNAKQRVTETQSDSENLNANYKQRKGFLQIGLRLFIVMLTLIFCLTLGVIAIIIDFSIGASVSNEILAAIMLIFAVIAAITAVMLARRRREAIAVLETDIAEIRDTLQALKQEARRQRQYLLPTQQTLKEVRADYKALKDTF